MARASIPLPFRKNSGSAKPSTPIAIQASRFLDQRLGIAKAANKQLRKVFPDHWSFMLGEITMYCFVILLITGVYLSFFFEPSSREVVYNGSYEALRGTKMSAAYKSALDISFHVRAGLIVRQIHHWAALLFVAAMVVHMLRVFFTGAYRKPREVNWLLGLGLLGLGMVNGFLGYSLLDDLLSGTGLRVGYSIALSIPVVGEYLANLFFGGPFPNNTIIPRFFYLHILVIPGLILGLVGAHVSLVWYQKHTQFRGPKRTEDNVIGTRLWPTYGAKALGLMFMVFGVLTLLGGLFQINPIWKFGPFRGDEVAAAVTSASQPDWYMGWPDGALRLVPGWETRFAGFEIPNYFWAGALLPAITFGIMGAWPFLEQRRKKDYQPHNLLDRPRDNPFRTAFGAGAFSFYTLLLFAGSNDVLGTIFHVAPETITLVLRVLVFVLPVIVFFITKRICNELKDSDAHPAYPGPAHEVTRTEAGGYDFGDH